MNCESMNHLRKMGIIGESARWYWMLRNKGCSAMSALSTARKMRDEMIHSARANGENWKLASLGCI